MEFTIFRGTGMLWIDMIFCDLNHIPIKISHYKCEFAASYTGLSN